MLVAKGGGVSANSELMNTPIHFAPQQLSRAEPFPPLTLGLLTLRGGGPSEQRQWQPELRMCQPLLFYLAAVISFRRQRLVTYAAPGISQPSSSIYEELSTQAY